jgi:predicted ATPase
MELSIEGFRLWRNARVAFPSGAPMVLIGPNASGKTSIVEALAFLSQAAAEGLSRAVYVRREGPGDFFSMGAKELTVEVLLSAEAGRPTEDDGGPVRYTLTLARRGAFVAVRREEIAVYKRGLAERPLVVARRDEVSCSALNVNTRQWDIVESVASDELMVRAVSQATAYPTLRHVQTALASFRVHTGFATTPRWARDPREGDFSPRSSATIRPQPHLDPRGFDVILTLFSLQQSYPERWAALLRSVQREFPFVSRLFFPPDPGGSKVALAWEDVRFPAPLSAEQMSEGMWSLLTLLAAIVPPNPPGLVAFDEPDAHLHPSALRAVVGLLEELAAVTTVVVTSHSSAILDDLSDPVASLRVASASEDGASLASLDADAMAAWVALYGGPSVLRRRGLLDDSNTSGGPR